MSSVFPTNLDTFTNPTDANRLALPNHANQHSDINDAVEALEAKVGKDGSTNSDSHDYKLSNITGLYTAIPDTGAGIFSANIYSSTITNAAMITPTFSGVIDGWITRSETWTYNAANVFNANGNSFAAGDYIKWIQPSGTKYGIVISSTGATITIATNTDYVIANEAISYNAYSRQANPFGFPSHFHWTPTITYAGGTTDPTSNVLTHAYFTVIGKECFFHLGSTLTIGGGDRAFTLYSVPITRPNNNILSFSARSAISAGSQPGGVGYSDDVGLIVLGSTMDQSGNIQIDGNYPIV